VDGHRVGYLGGADDRRHIEVAQCRGRGPYADGLIREQYVLEVVVNRGVHGDGLDVQFTAGAQYAQRNLAAVRNDDFVQHAIGSRYSITNSGWPNSTGSPFFAMIAVTRPDRSHSIWFIIFIASMMQRTWPSLTSSPSETKGLAVGEDAA